MSDYIQQRNYKSNFNYSNSWAILSKTQLNIKNKIESIGTPLKEWNINIYRGVLTGYNEAFIISTEKRDEILANCQDFSERERTEELIRPILRGRDIKEYSYEWNNLWLIATFPSMNYDIEEYPSLKKYFEEFGIKKLEQSGNIYIVNNQNIKARKKTNNKWFETQDSIKYWEDFLKPKIIYPNMTKYMPFVFDDKGYLTNQKCFILTGENLAYLTALFNSSLFKYCFRNSFPELQGGTRELSKIYFEKIPILKVTPSQNQIFEVAINEIQNKYSKEKALYIDSLIFDLYCLNDKEREAIGFFEIK